MNFDKTKLFKLKKALLKLGEISTEEGTTLIYDTDTLDVDVEVFVNGEEGLTPAPDGEYTYNNKIYSVVGGKIVEIKQKAEEAETTTTETTETTETVEENMEEETPTDDKDAKIAELEATIETLNAKIAELEAKLAEPVVPSVEEELKEPKSITRTEKYDYTAMVKRLRNKE